MYPQTSISTCQRKEIFIDCIFKGDEGRPTFALSKLHWGAFRDANEKQDK